MAGSGIKTYVGRVSAIPDYTKFEDIEKAETEAGYNVNAAESTTNGYQMTGATVGEVATLNGAGRIEQREKDISIVYSKADGEDITLNTRKLLEGESEETVIDFKAEKSIQCGDIKVSLDNSTYKLVPGGYEMTEEDEIAMENGELDYISEGAADTPAISQFCYVGWVEDNTLYSLSGFGLSLSDDEMLHMAKEIIESHSQQ